MTNAPTPKYIKNFMFTINNPTMDPTTLLESIAKPGTNIKYCIFQREKGETGTIHYQGYAELAHSKRFDSVSKLFPTAHIESRRGTAVQARDYCQKPETQLEGPFEYGIFTEPKPGSRTDLSNAVTELALHRDISRIAVDHGPAFIKYHRGFEKYLEVTAPSRTEPPRVYLYFGPTGTGKTRLAYKDDKGLFRKHPDGRWFDGLRENDTVLLDDFNGAASKMSLSYVLQMLDRYPFDVEVKGGHKHLLAKTIVLTSNNHPNTWWDYNTRLEGYKALARRFHKVIYFGESESFEVDCKKFFGNTPYETPPSYTDIRLKPRQWLGEPEDSDLEDYTDETMTLTIENSSGFDNSEPYVRKPRLRRQLAFSDFEIEPSEQSIESDESSEDLSHELDKTRSKKRRRVDVPYISESEVEDHSQDLFQEFDQYLASKK